MPETPPIQMDRPWRLALVVEDHDALRVAAAYYAIKPSERDDLDLLAEVSGVHTGINEVLTRLRVAGMLTADKDPPPVLSAMLTQYVTSRLAPPQRR